MELPTGDPLTLALLLAAALVAGMVDAIAGGGGLIVLPALLAAGLPPHVALGTNKLAGTFGTLSATAAFIRKGLLRPRHWRATAVLTAAGAAAGTLLVSVLDAQVVRGLIPPVVILAGLYVMLRRPPRRIGPGVPAPEPRSGPVLGSALGFYDGLVGPGTGAFWVSGAMALFRLDLVQASGLARAMNFVSNVVSLTAFALLGMVDYTLGLAMAAALMGGAWIGAHTAIRYGAPFIRPVFLAVVVALAGSLIWEHW